MRVSTALTVCLALGGCSLQPTDNRAAFEASSDMVPAAQPMAQLPAAAGEQLSMLQSNLQGPLTQKIVLQGDPATGGENRIVVTVDLDQPMPGEADYKVPKPTDELIAKELDDTMPGIAMTISPNFVRNDFGPFGYAIGRAYGGVTCIYAWQWSPGQAPRFLASPEGQAADLSRPKAATSVRVRLCKQGLGERELVDLVHHMAVYPPGSNTPYLDTTYGMRPLVSADSLSSSGVARGYYLEGAEAPATPTTVLRVAVASDGAAHKTKHRRHHRRAHARNAKALAREIYEPVAVSPLAGRTIAVPMPGEGGGAAGAPSNALLAPLQNMRSSKPLAMGQAASDLPLPAPLAGATAAAPSPALPAPQ